MKRLILLLTILVIHFTNGQEFNLKIEGKSIEDTNFIDSITYFKKHKNIESILKTVKTFDSTLIKNGFLEAKFLEQKKINDSSFTFFYDIGKKTNSIRIYIGKLSEDEKKLLQLDKDTLSLSIGEIENFVTSKLNQLERNGFSLSKISLINYKKINKHLFADLLITLNSKRFVDELVILGYDKFPKNIKQRFEKNIKKRLFNKNLVTTVYKDFNELPFVNQIKYPEILFTDSLTKIYTYVEKTRPNKFDGFIGFANDEKSKLVFNGYLDLVLQNILNSGERLNLYWRNDGNNQTSFNIGTEIPYLFKSPLGIKADLKIFKQDSLFQNTQNDINLGYYFTFNKKVYLGYQSTTSVDIQNLNSFTLNNFKNKFYTSNFIYNERNNKNILFPQKTYLNIKAGIGNRTIVTKKNNQYFVQLSYSHIFYLNTKNSIYLKTESFYLDSENYIINELYRFGGINSIRGFRENSIQANFFTGIISEYRYNLSDALYLHSILDYGYFQDKTASVQNKLLGIGFGFGLLTNNGLFNLVYSNGSVENQQIKLSNSIFQMNFKAIF